MKIESSLIKWSAKPLKPQSPAGRKDPIIKVTVNQPEALKKDHLKRTPLDFSWRWVTKHIVNLWTSIIAFFVSPSGHCPQGQGTYEKKRGQSQRNFDRDLSILFGIQTPSSAPPGAQKFSFGSLYGPSRPTDGGNKSTPPIAMGISYSAGTAASIAWAGEQIWFDEMYYSSKGFGLPFFWECAREIGDQSEWELSAEFIPQYALESLTRILTEGLSQQLVDASTTSEVIRAFRAVLGENFDRDLGGMSTIATSLSSLAKLLPLVHTDKLENKLSRVRDRAKVEKKLKSLYGCLLSIRAWLREAKYIGVEDFPNAHNNME